MLLSFYGFSLAKFFFLTRPIFLKMFFLIFSKSLLYSLNDPEQSSSIGASVVLKFFIQNKGSELFHALPELVKESLHVCIRN